MCDAADEDQRNPVANAAAGRGHLHVLQWLRKQNPKFLEDGKVFHSAAIAGHLHILQWLGKQPPVKVRGTALVSEQIGIRASPGTSLFAGNGRFVRHWSLHL